MIKIHIVKCFYCQKNFDRDKIEPALIGKRRYAHKECAKQHEAEAAQVQTDEQKLEEYIMKLFNEPYVNARIKKQIKTYISSYNYTYSGILKALIYQYEIKGGSIEKANGGIGIVPYIYNEAYQYYYSLWLAQQKNEDKVLTNFIPQVKIITIPVPERKIKKRKLFSFLDKDEDI